MAGFSSSSTNPAWIWYETDDIYNNYGNNFSFLAERSTEARSRAIGGHPVGDTNSTQPSGSIEFGTSYNADSVFLDDYYRRHKDKDHDADPSTAFSNMSINESPSYSSPQPHSERHTPSSLGWDDQTRVAEYYNLNLGKSPKEHHLVLKSGNLLPPDNYYMPTIVYLDTDVRQHTDKRHHPCMYPGRSCWKYDKQRVFTRAADLERHYNVVHTLGEEIKCDYPRCSRHTDAFTRKDHCRDHYKEYHKEDIGGPNRHIKMDKERWQAKREQWEEERQISADWWRCPKCLGRVQIATDGWYCTPCKRDCEEHRKTARLELEKREEKSNNEVEPEVQSFTPKFWLC